MFKKIIKGAVVGAAALMITVPAYAATVEVHLFGASAQFNFWTSAAPKFLADPAGANCLGAVEHAQSKGLEVGGYSKRDTGIARGFNCQGVGDDIIMSYTSYSSQKGIQAVQGSATDDGCAIATHRAAPAWSTGGVNWAAYPGTAGTVTALACQQVAIGASDVAGETFGQTSSGQDLGPLGGGFKNYTANPVDTTGLESCRPIVVPFAFYAHENTAVVPTGSQGNLSRLMATALFSGSVNNWSKFGLASQPVTVCLRHAGSGTHATLDAAVMRGEANMVQNEVLPGSFENLFLNFPVVYFNKGSSDMMKCLRDAGAGAVGYADADANGAAYDGSDGSYPTVQRLSYMGADATADNIKNGVYDFWAFQWLYYRTNEAAVVKNKIEELCDYAAVGANMPVSRAGFWAAEGDMQVSKADDFAWPKFK